MESPAAPTTVPTHPLSRRSRRLFRCVMTPVADTDVEVANPHERRPEFSGGEQPVTLPTVEVGNVAAMQGEHDDVRPAVVC